MKQLSLVFLWFLCAAFVALLLIAYFHSCSPRPELWMPPPPLIPPLPPPAPAKPKASEPPQSYTYVGAAQSGASDSARPDPSAPREAKPKPAPAADSAVTLDRDAFAEAATGAIPDLDLRLDGVPLDEVIQRYGYVPAVKSRNRLLGKISGEEFLPLAPEELSRYARRGRAGAGHPEAGRWLARVAAELALPAAGLQFIFLVPHHTEALFIEAERRALRRAGKTASQVALVRAHVDAGLAVVVDELVTTAGEIIAVDSVRVPAKNLLP
jgi:hypothetical protein